MPRHLDIAGRPTDGPVLRVGLIGCGSHAFRNVHPALHFLPVRVEATADLDAERARLFAERYGAPSWYTDYQKMLGDGTMDAVVVVLNYDDRGRPKYPQVAADCLQAGCHVWIEKPPAATEQEMLDLDTLCRATGRKLMVGFKKVFFPANVKAMELCRREEFGGLSAVLLRYPQFIPTAQALRAYLAGERLSECVGFLDHLCHPVSLLLAIAGMPNTLYYTRADNGGGIALFTFEAGHTASIALTCGQSGEMPLEHTTIVGHDGWSIEVQNNLRVLYYPNRGPNRGYGVTPSWYLKAPEETVAYWEPEFSLGQLHNKGLFLLGYYDELRYFVEAVLYDRPIERAGVTMAAQATRIFEAFAQGPGKVISLA